VVKKIIFEWDRWNLQKNERKHGVSKIEAESVFFDPGYKLYADIKHSTPKEARMVLYGKGLENRVLMVGFTMRNDKIRIITARSASQKERRLYEEE
jgi:uncharacterized protein